MSPTPLYTSENIDSPAYHLRYSWTGWPSAGTFPPAPDESFFETLEKRWETDGIRPLERKWSAEQIQFTCSVRATVSPTVFAGRVKGRLEHAFRKAGTRINFSRKVAFRSLGESKREQVEAYIAKQATKERFVDSRFEALVANYTQVNHSVRLEEPTETTRGRYWYDLHIVLVTDHRMRFTDETSLACICDTCDKVAGKKGHRIATWSVMPDHVHLALRGNVEQSPEEVALGFMNNIAFAFGQKAVFRPSYYVGTFGEYDMGAVRR